MGSGVMGWDRPPLFRWTSFQRLLRVQSEVAALRAETLQDEGALPTTSTVHNDHAMEFVERMQAMLPSLDRPRCVDTRARQPGLALKCVVSSWAAAGLSREASARAVKPEPEPPLSTANPSAPHMSLQLHFHSMPGSWAMECWGAPPQGFCWGIAIYPLLQRFTLFEADLEANLPGTDLSTARGAARLHLDHICFKPHIELAKFSAADPRYPLLVIRCSTMSM